MQQLTQIVHLAFEEWYSGYLQSCKVKSLVLHIFHCNSYPCNLVYLTQTLQTILYH